MGSSGSGRTVWDFLGQNLPKVWGTLFMKIPGGAVSNLPIAGPLVDSARAGFWKNGLKKVTFRELVREVRS